MVDIKFSLNQELDVWKINSFFPKISAPGGYNLQDVITKAHPDLKGLELVTSNKRSDKIKNYVSKYYQQHGKHLAEIVDQVGKDWQEYAPTFFKVASGIFKGLAWPSGEYRACYSISPPYPRFIDKKIFQFGRREHSLQVISHEMLHFIFYEYVRVRYTPQLKNTDEKAMNKLLDGKFIIPLWELSEVFDTALLTSDRFGKAGEGQFPPYPALKNYLKTFSQIWQEVNGDIDLLFSKLEL